ncbi:MAG: ABC transporter substrate-binding protein [Tatlockia sp.]|jgi:polar amino acid transport system substrate-binding protein
MKKLTTCLMLGSLLFQTACDNKTKLNDPHKIYFATAGEYPPFEYKQRGELKGFDIALAQRVAKELGKEAVFEDMSFASILPALSSGQVDAAISTITLTKARKKNFDFTMPYYFEGMAAVFRKNEPVKTISQFAGKKLAAQLGSTMELWLKKHAAHEVLVVMDNNNQAIEALKAGHVDMVLMDGAQGAIFSRKNPILSYALIAKSEEGYAIALPKHSRITRQMNQILASLIQKGEIEKLKQTWLEQTA